MTKPEDLNYIIDGRRLIAETDDLRVQILTLAADEEVPWHYHTQVTDSFVCLHGPMVVTTRDPDRRHELKTGDVLEVPPETVHRVTGKDAGACSFVIVQGIGAHDFFPVDDEWSKSDRGYT